MLLDGAVAHRKRRQRYSWTALLQDCSINSCKVVASTEKTEVLLDGSVARLSHRQRRQRYSCTALLQDCHIDGVETWLSSQRRRQRLNGEDNWLIPCCMSQTWRGGFYDHQLLPIYCIPSWCLRNKPPNNTESHGY